MAHHRPNRRQFLTTTAATLAIPTILPRSVLGANEKIVTGHVGVRNQGLPNLKAFLKKASPAAVCDVDKDVLATAVKTLEAGGVASPFACGDYRELLDRKDIDAVVITTPDHWHALMTVDACAAGKDVYCEKPLSLTIDDGKKMVQAARKHDRVVQTGSQQRSDVRFRRACEIARSGKLGKIHTVIVGIPAVNFDPPPVPDSNPPANLDYDRWLGPAPERPYNAKRVHYLFRFFWDYSGGQMTNFGAHHIDIAQWGLGMDDSGPIASEGKATFHPEKWYEVPMACRVYHTYANGVTLIVGQQQKDCPGGTTFIGSEGRLHVDRGKIVSEPGDIAKAEPSASDVRLYESADHHLNFLECVKSRKRPICDVEIGHRSATVCHLGNIALRLGRRIQWDPKAETIVGDDEAQGMLSRKYRSPWSI
ncbi:MAG: Gfo/Idh/MocA family protein [Isosphaeraceae bacterium]